MLYEILQSHCLKYKLTKSHKSWLRRALQVVALPSRYATLVLDYEQVSSWEEIFDPSTSKTNTRLSNSPIWHNLLVLSRYKDLYAIALLHIANFFFLDSFLIQVSWFSIPQATYSSNTSKSHFEFPAQFTSDFQVSNGLTYKPRGSGPAALPTTAQGPP